MGDYIVFVLGAGASFDLGFPLGVKLVEEILLLLSGSGPETYKKLYLMSSNEHGEAVVSSMAESLRKSSLISIDRFLEQHRENLAFQDIGYKSIALIINQRENETALNGNREDHWYRLLHNRLHEKYRDFQGYKSAPIAFITFNYDRSLERFLFNAIKYTYPNIQDVEKEFLESLQPRILHVHGSLGSILEFPYRPLHVDRDQNFEELLSGCSGQLKIIGEVERDVGIHARQVIGEAKAIHIMGFGYDPANMHTIGLPDAASKECLIQGMKIGLAEAQSYSAMNELRKGRNTNAELFNFDCTKYFQERVGL